MDENVEGPITRGVRRRGVDVLTVQDDGRTGADDSDVLTRATELGRVLFSRDEDMLAEAARRQSRSEPFTGVIYAHQDHVTVGECVAELELATFAGNDEDFANRVRYLPFR